MNKIILSAAVVAALLSTRTMAISDGIRSDRTNECAIYMCLPSKFGTGCAAVHSAYNARIHDVDHKGRRKYTDLPSFKYCKDENNENVTDLPEAKASNFTYENLYEITIPDTNTCTRWTVRRFSGDNHSVRRCAAVNTVKGRVFDSNNPNHTYQNINIGDSSYSTHRAIAKLFTVVKADGVAVGNKYYK